MHSSNTGRLPLAGVRVTDLTQVWAGPYATRFLADMGAEVIKVESTKRPDPWRMSGRPTGPGDRYFDREPRSSEYNRNKLAITLDLTSEAGIRELKSLVAISDVVAENFSAGVMERLGLGYEVLKQIRPEIIMISMPGFGSKGPEAGFRAYGPIQEAMGGVISVTGYRDRPPLETHEYYGDPTGAIFGASALFAALFNQKRTGRGVYIDFSQREAMIACLPEVMLEYTIGGRTLGPIGNSHPYKAPHGCYRCAGEDDWLVLSIGSDSEWAALCEAMEMPKLRDDERFATALERLENEDELNAVIETWTRQHEHYQLMHLLQGHGIAAQAVFSTAEMVSDPHLQARGFIQRVDHPISGDHLTMALPWQIDGMSAPIRRPSPMLGQHNREVLCELLGVSTEEYEALERDGVIGDYPVNPAPARPS